MDRKHQSIKINDDPRLSIIDKNLKNVKRIILVASGKGGVGKSSISATISLMLKKQGHKVGLLDLDFQGPTCHIILNKKKQMPIEEYGVVPPEINGVKFFSIVYYSDKNPLALRGFDTSNIIKEMLSITKWKDLDFLIIDMPPGLSDEIFDVLKFIKRVEVLIVSTPSVLSLETTEKTVEVFKKNKIIGVIENMTTLKNNDINNLAERHSIKYLGYIPFYDNFEDIINKPNVLVDSNFGKKIEDIIESFK